MLNLLGFLAVADHSAAPALKPESLISGQAAYALYMQHTLPYLAASISPGSATAPRRWRTRDYHHWWLQPPNPSEIGMSLRDHRAGDSHALYCLRRDAILELCPPVLSREQAQDWASKHTVDSMFERLCQTEGWVAELDGRVVGWISLKVDYIDGLYVDPRHAGTGIGSNLLRYLEGKLTTRGIASVRTDASLNARDFYLRRGYAPTGLQSSGDSLSLSKTLVAPERMP